MLSFLQSFGLFLIIGIPLLALVIIPIFIYHKTILIASKYTLTKFLISWPLVIISSIFKGFMLIILTIISFFIFAVVLNLILVLVFEISNATLDIITTIELFTYLICILGYVIYNTVTYFEEEED